MHLEQNHCQLHVKGNLGKCWLIRSSIYTDITTGVLLIKSDFLVYSDIILVFLFQRQCVSWEHTGLAGRRPGLWFSLPTWPWGSNLFWLRLSFLTCKRSFCTKPGFQDKACLSCFVRWLVKGHLNPSLKLTGHHIHQPASPGHNPSQCLSLIYPYLF